eukprot:8603628-Pyramimonas_sp.AAC.1
MSAWRESATSRGPTEDAVQTDHLLKITSTLVGHQHALELDPHVLLQLAVELQVVSAGALQHEVVAVDVGHELAVASA